MFRKKLLIGIAIALVGASAAAKCNETSTVTSQTDCSKELSISRSSDDGLVIEKGSKVWRIQPQARAGGELRAIDGNGEAYAIVNRPLTRAEIHQLRAKMLVRKADSKLQGGPATLSFGGEYDPYEDALDLGPFGFWERGPHMDNSYFWSDVVFDPYWQAVFGNQDRKWQCMNDLENCLSTTQTLKDMANSVCGGLILDGVVPGLACFAAVHYLVNKANNDCWGKYAGCIALAPSGSTTVVSWRRGSATPSVESNI